MTHYLAEIIRESVRRVAAGEQFVFPTALLGHSTHETMVAVLLVAVEEIAALRRDRELLVTTIRDLESELPPMRGVLRHADPIGALGLLADRLESKRSK